MTAVDASVRQDQPRSASGRDGFWRQVWDARWCYVIMVPSLALAVMFTFYPALASWYISFLDWPGIGAESVFVGLSNYREAIADPFFWDAFLRTFAFAGVAVPVMLGLALVVAIVLNDQALRLRTVFRTMFFLPVVTTTAIVGIVMGLIMNPFDGPLNAALLSLGVIDRPINFLGNPDIALWSVVGVFIWKWMGISMIYWLVALQTVPQTLYEAAETDRANRWQMHRHVTLPLILPFAIIIILIGFVGALQVFPLMQAMTGGGPALSTELVELYIYRLAFVTDTQPRFGYASAVAVFFGLTVLLFTVAQGLGVRRANAVRSQLREGA
jgi:multiple sugar transport system permease protein